MLSKQETIELLRYPIYKVEVWLLTYPHVGLDYDVHIIGGEWVNTRKPSIHRDLFWYIHTEESIERGEESIKSDLDVNGYVLYYLQIRDGEVYEVSDEVLNELERIVNVGTTPILLGFTDDGLYKITGGPLSKEDQWILETLEQME